MGRRLSERRIRAATPSSCAPARARAAGLGPRQLTGADPAGAPGWTSSSCHVACGEHCRRSRLDALAVRALVALSTHSTAGIGVLTLLMLLPSSSRSSGSRLGESATGSRICGVATEGVTRVRGELRGPARIPATRGPRVSRSRPTTAATGISSRGSWDQGRPMRNHGGSSLSDAVAFASRC